MIRIPDRNSNMKYKNNFCVYNTVGLLIPIKHRPVEEYRADLQGMWVLLIKCQIFGCPSCRKQDRITFGNCF